MSRAVGALWVLVAWAVASCSPELRLDVNARNAVPYADAGTGGEVLVGTTVMLDGSGSFDPDGTITSYHWLLAKKPMDSNAAVVDAGRELASLTLDTTGEFVLELDVVDSGGKSAGSRL